jgi:hypothetical protein
MYATDLLPLAAEADCVVCDYAFSDTPTFTEAQWTDTFNRVFKAALEACGYS